MRTLLLILALSCHASGAVAYDNASSGQSAAAATSLTFSHTTGSLTNGMIIVGASYFDATRSVSTITYNGVALTKIRRDNNGVQNAATELWYLLAPASGANNVVITMDAAISGGSQLVGGAITLQGVIQNAPEANTGSIALSTHTTHSDNITTVAANAWTVDAIGFTGGIPSFVAGGSQTARVNEQGASFNSIGMSTLPVVSPGSTAVSYSFASTTLATAHSVASVAPAVVSTAKMRRLIGQ